MICSDRGTSACGTKEREGVMYRLIKFCVARKMAVFCFCFCFYVVSVVLSSVTGAWYLSFLGVPAVFFISFIDDLELMFRPIVLSKRVCSKCLRDYGWGVCEDVNWRSRKETFCMGCGKTVRTDRIPEDCKYKLEHIVLK